MTTHHARTRRTPQNTIQSLQTSRRVYDCKTYPVQTPQGSTVLIYGHQNGVTILWRGGRRLRAAPVQNAKSKQNGNASDSVMIIDSDEEGEGAANTDGAAPTKAAFEEGIDDSAKYEIVQDLDLTLGTAVTHIAVLPIAPCKASDTENQLLQEKLVFAVACVTKEVYVVTLPLTPPSTESKQRPQLRAGLLEGRAGSGVWGESLILLDGQRKPCDGLAITLAASNASQRSQASDVVVACHSREAAGTLRLWYLSCHKPKPNTRPTEPFQTEYLPKPLSSISFNPTRSTQLLAVSSTDAVRVYDFAQSPLPPDPDATGPFPAQGSWLLSLYQPFARSSPLRKPIVAAEWVAHGRAVFALLADGMWGIWDIDGGSPLSDGGNMNTKLKSSLTGAALTAFGVSGFLEGSGSLRSGTAPSKDSRSGDFAPMTPHTRKQAKMNLSSSASPDRLSAIHGGIKVMPLASTGKELQDETIALWIGSLDHVFVIPGISRFWDSQLRKGSGGGVNLFSGAQPTRMIKLGELEAGLSGERLSGIDLVLNSTTNRAEDGGLSTDTVLLGETRMAFVQQGDHVQTGGLVEKLRMRKSSSGTRSNAIIVHGQQNQTPLPPSLSLHKTGSLRKRPSLFERDEDPEAGLLDRGSALQLPSRPRGGFEFAQTLNEAADASADLSRDVDMEMLDIMQIDQALDSLEGSRGAGRKKVFFEDD